MLMMKAGVFRPQNLSASARSSPSTLTLVSMPTLFALVPWLRLVNLNGRATYKDTFRLSAARSSRCRTCAFAMSPPWEER